MSKRLLAVAPVCASIPERLCKEFYPVQPVSVLIMNGTQDPLVKYTGGPVGNKLTDERGNRTHTDSSVLQYIMGNKTATTPSIEIIPDKNERDQCTAVKYLYTGGLNHSKVCLVKINNGGHNLPAASQYLPKFIFGRVCNDFKGNEMIWEFFRGRGK